MQPRTKAPRPLGRGGLGSTKPVRKCSANSPANELDERTRRDSSRSFWNSHEISFRIRGAGNIEMRPRISVSELLEKHRGSYRTSRTAPRVLDIGDIGFDEFLVVVPQRQRPTRFARRPSASVLMISIDFPF